LWLSNCTRLLDQSDTIDMERFQRRKEKEKRKEKRNFSRGALGVGGGRESRRRDTLEDPRDWDRNQEVQFVVLRKFLRERARYRNQENGRQ